ncbi:hypothetical protein HIM_09235 [Hirsutella minnesotensis 3608]|uniref:Uncharacterized protein n=1 Tax=Hirsutella minnesotensis 3608 TaxID=1043627 RepID=A0A0F7ZXU9_9HYPO|nr:hypothetical protein HIM_09235 [Hirsutella minnesotensis 3608]
MTDFSACTSPSPACPVEATTYGYAPALWANATLLAIFAACCLAQLALAATTRVYSYSLAAGAGALLETIVCLIIGPSFTAAAVYLTAKHVVRRDGPEYSPLRPDLYTWVFIGCDAGSIALQAIGGGRRLPEMAGGWGNPRMRNETEFLVLDGLMVLLATLALTLAHPGFLYPVMRTTRTPKQDGSVEQQQIGEK